MKNPDEMITEEGFVLKFRERESEDVTLSIPKDVLASLEKVAKKRDLPVHALLKLYIGRNLRQDLATIFQTTSSNAPKKFSRSICNQKTKFPKSCAK